MFKNSLSRKPFIVGYGLKCYSCGGKEDDCTKDKLEGDKDKKSMTCPDGMDRCVRSWMKKKDDDDAMVANSCSSETLCKEAEEVCKKAEDDDEGECAIGCCEGDYCNASSTVSFSVILLAACSMFGLALLK